jgi:RsiW-degrading membrane proteinase PrsW (M82 family)
MSLILAALFPALLIALLFYYLDRNPEPVKEIARAFFVGILTVLLAVLAGLVFSIPREVDGTFLSSIINSFWNAAFIEEMSKILLFLLLVYRRKNFDEWYDGILYGIMIGLGFAFVENVMYFYSLFGERGWSIVITRSILSMPVHAMLGGIMGFFIGRAKFKISKGYTYSFVFLALIIPVGLHGFFNFFLMLNNGVLSIVSCLVSFSMWILVLKLKKRTQLAV